VIRSSIAFLASSMCSVIFPLLPVKPGTLTVMPWRPT
jgi:hypothetical protein